MYKRLSFPISQSLALGCLPPFALLGGHDVCMYVCMFVCAYVYSMHVCMYVCMNVCMYICMHECMYA